MPSFGRTLGLPSASSIPWAERPNLPRERHEVVRLFVAFSARALGRSLRTVRDGHPRQSPRRSSSCRSRGDGETRSFSGLRLPIDFCNTYSTRGHVREPRTLLRARLPPHVRVRAASENPTKSEEPCRLATLPSSPSRGRRRFRSEDDRECFRLGERRSTGHCCPEQHGPSDPE